MHSTVELILHCPSFGILAGFWVSRPCHILLEYSVSLFVTNSGGFRPSFGIVGIETLSHLTSIFGVFIRVELPWDSILVPNSGPKSLSHPTSIFVVPISNFVLSEDRTTTRRTKAFIWVHDRVDPDCYSFYDCVLIHAMPPVLLTRCYRLLTHVEASHSRACF